MNPTWPDPDAFYAADTRRGDSPEVDLGHRWFMERHQPPYRLTYLQATGELVLLREDTDPYCELVGWFPTIADVRKALGPIKPGYGQPKGVYEIRIACRKKAIAGADVTDQHRAETFARHRGAQQAGESQDSLF